MLKYVLFQLKNNLKELKMNTSLDYTEYIKNGNTFVGDVFIEKGAKIGHNNVFGHNCVITGDVSIGDNNIFDIGTYIGALSRERRMGVSKEKNVIPDAKVIIGNNNIFEPYSVIQGALETETIIGNNVCIGSYAHISHDSILHDNVIVSFHCTVAGYCIIYDWVNIGMSATLHQRSVVGAFAMIGAGATVVNHIAPAAVVAGVPAKYIHVNSVGLKRFGINDIMIKETEMWLSGVNNTPLFLTTYWTDFLNGIEIWKRRKAIIPDIN